MNEGRFSGAPKFPNEAPKVSEAARFNDIVEELRFLVKGDNELDDELQGIILEALDVSIDDFKQDVLDRSKTYSEKTMDEKIGMFFVRTLRDKILEYSLDTSQRDAFNAFLNSIVDFGDKKEV